MNSPNCTQILRETDPEGPLSKPSLFAIFLKKMWKPVLFLWKLWKMSWGLTGTVRGLRTHTQGDIRGKRDSICLCEAVWTAQLDPVSVYRLKLSSGFLLPTWKTTHKEEHVHSGRDAIALLGVSARLKCRHWVMKVPRGRRTKTPTIQANKTCLR